MPYDNQGMKWLHVRNWELYQASGKLFHKDARLPWVKDWTEKLDNYDYQQLTMFERALFEGVCLIAGTRPLRSMPNDVTWLSGTLHIKGTERSRVGHALTRLIEHGYVFPSNDENFSEAPAVTGSEKAAESRELRLESREERGERGKLAGKQVNYDEATASSSQGQQKQKQNRSSAEQDKSNPNTEDSYIPPDAPAANTYPWWDTVHEAFGVAVDLNLTPKEAYVFNQPMLYYHWDASTLSGCIRWAMTHKFWKSRIVDFKSLAKAMLNSIVEGGSREKGLMAQYQRHLDGKKAK